MVEKRELTWKPQGPEEQAYFSLNEAQQANNLGLFRTFLEPALTALGLWKTSDPTYGRGSLPLSPAERALRNDSRYTVTDGKVYIVKPAEKGSSDSKGDIHKHTPLHSTTGEAWIAYQTWVDENAARKTGRNADLLYAHGINDYGGKFSRHARDFLAAGYRLIVPDMPSHGRSTGLSAYITDMQLLSEAIHAVICQVWHDDNAPADAEPRKLFVAGQSMGGFAAISYALRYPIERPESSPYGLVKGVGPRPTLSGVLVLCPMLAIAPETMPAKPVELGKETDDPNISAEFESDPQGYHGRLRIHTGLAILRAILDANARLGELTMPIKVFHGTRDRVTSVSGSQKLVDMAASKDKDLQLLEGYEHVILAEGRNEQDDQKRQRVLKDMLDWLNAHT